MPRRESNRVLVRRQAALVLARFTQFVEVRNKPCRRAADASLLASGCILHSARAHCLEVCNSLGSVSPACAGVLSSCRDLGEVKGGNCSGDLEFLARVTDCVYRCKIRKCLIARLLDGSIDP